ncbi:MAG: hypothetical protein ACI399_04950 [Candidatus Cryptobacteroides sp.]
MKKTVLIAIALGLLLASACGGRQEKKKTIQEEPITELLGELEEGCLGDSVIVYTCDGVNEEYTAYPIIDEMFAVNLKTDRMTTGSIMILYDGGLSNGFFVPEGGKIRFRMNKRGKVTISTPRGNSISEDYSNLSRESSNLHFRLVRQRDSVAKADGLTGESLDSLDALFKGKYDDVIRKQSLETLKKHGDDVLGVIAINNILVLDGADAARKLMTGLSEEAKNHPAIPDSLKF